MNKTFDEIKADIENSGLFRELFKLSSIDDTIKLNNKITFKNYIRVLKIIFYVFILAPLIDYILMDLIQITIFNNYLITFSILIVIFSIECLILWRINIKKIKKAYKKAEIEGIKPKISLYNEGIIVTDDSSVSAYYYSAMKRIEKVDKDSFFFQVNSKIRFFISPIAEDNEEKKLNDKKFIDYLYEKKYIKPDLIAYKNKPILGFFLLILLFFVSVFIICNTYTNRMLCISYAFFMLRMYIIIYSYFINRLSIKSSIFCITLSFISIFLGYYIFYFIYYLNYYSNYGIFNLFINLFSIVSHDEIVKWTALKDYFLDSSLIFSLSLLFNSIYIEYLVKNNKNDVKAITLEKEHLSKEIKHLIFYIIILLILIANIARVTLFNAFEDFIDDAVFKGFAGDNLVSLVLRYEDSLKRLKEVDEEAYDKARDTLLMQSSNIYSDFNVNEYYIDSSRYEFNDVITIYCSSIYDSYDLYYEIYDYGTESYAEWSDWYGDNGSADYVDLEVSVEGNGYCIVNIWNSLDRKTISIFIDNIDKNNNYQSENTIFIENY